MAGKSSNGTKDLVIVESPAKARTIERILGKNFVVKASVGHVRDLPKSKLGVDLENDFSPSYVIPRGKNSVVKDLKQLGNKARWIYLATDPDREGEAISWHLVNAAKWNTANIKRVVFHEITPPAIKEAFDAPREIDMHLVDAQQARRIVDRLVGYKISPILWRRVQRGLSAGRVQSVALRIIVERDQLILNFVPKEFWKIDANLLKVSENGSANTPFKAHIHSVNKEKKKISITSKEDAQRILQELDNASFTVADVKKKKIKQAPSPPFITSTLQQDSWRKFRFSAKKTMVLAQQLYEGLMLGKNNPTGLITYMRTDSIQVSSSAIQETRKYIAEELGKEYLPTKPTIFRKKSKGAQEAHEAIRPTSIYRHPESVKQWLDTDQLKLYSIIWKRMVASQISPALSDSTTVDITAKCKNEPKTYTFRTAGSILTFKGFRVIYTETLDDPEDTDNSQNTLPNVTVGAALQCDGIETKQTFTKPPPSYTEATLIKILEEQGIGRPSTYAPIISTILDRHYVEKDGGKFVPTALGKTICELLVNYFADILDVTFTSTLEESLDDVAKGTKSWVPMLKAFYETFDKNLKRASDEMPTIRIEEETDEHCEKCEKPMVIKTGRFGRFLACTGFPECRNTKQVLKNIGVACPECGGDIVERRSRARKRLFYGCSHFPTCNFLTNQKPSSDPCPECDGLLVTSRRNLAECIKCQWSGPIDHNEPALQDA